MVFLAQLASAQSAKYRVLVGGRELGSGTLVQKLTPGGLSTKFQMSLNAGGQKFTMSAEDMTRLDGTPVWAQSSESTPTGTTKIREDYSATGVKVRKTDGSGTTTKTFKLPAGSIKGISDLWFVTLKPKPGAVDKSFSFSASNMKWDQSMTKYVGVRTITVKGKSVGAHFITSKEADFWSDSKGIPYRIVFKEAGLEMILERA